MGEVSQGFGEGGGRNPFVREESPSCLCNGEGIFDAGGHGDTSGGSGGLLHMLADDLAITLDMTLVGKINLDSILRSIAKLHKFEKTNSRAY